MLVRDTCQGHLNVLLYHILTHDLTLLFETTNHHLIVGARCTALPSKLKDSTCFLNFNFKALSISTTDYVIYVNVTKCQILFLEMHII